jgi:hypothetical protein
LYTSCVLWVAPLCAFSINFTYQKKEKEENETKKSLKLITKGKTQILHWQRRHPTPKNVSQKLYIPHIAYKNNL